MSTEMMYYSLVPPVKWKAGTSAPNTPNEVVFYFDCADCGAKEPEIAGILSSDGTFLGMAVLKIEGSSFFNPAMFCAACYQARLAPPEARAA